MKLFGFISVFIISTSAQAMARVMQILPSPEPVKIAPPQNIIYTRAPAPTPDPFYDNPLFIGIVVFAALIIGLVLGLMFARRTDK